MRYKNTGLKAAAGLWTPAVLSPVLWFDARDITTITKDGSNKVTGWRNKGSAVVTAAPMAGATDYYKPTFVYPGAIAGQPAMRFDGDRNDLGGSFTFGGNTGTAFWFGTQNTQLNTTTGGILDMGATSNSNVASAADVNCAWFRRTTTYFQTKYNAATLVQFDAFWDIPFMWCVVRSAADQMFYAYVNDAEPAVASAAALSSRTFGSNVFTMGVNLGANAVANTLNIAADYYELFLFSSALSQSDRNKLHGYVAHKWSKQDLLAAGHPYKNAPP